MTDHTSPRMAEMHAWLVPQLARDGITDYSLAPASDDASFRRYFRITDSADTARTRIVMDAPPQFEDCRPFVRVAALLQAGGLHAPRVHAQNVDDGFLLLDDLGTQTYLDVLGESNFDPLFRAANEALVKWQLASKPGELPAYDEQQILRELSLFPDWFISRHLGVTLTARQQAVLQSSFSLIARCNLAEPRVFVHSDYMPRNLMVCEPGPGIIDFQDAVYGPISYDVASLYRDAFISWDEERVLDGTIRYWESARRAGLPVNPQFGDFYRDVEWMGLQRHLRILGIFARIHYRDGKQRYLADAPRFVGYVRKTCQRYGALRPLLGLLDELKIGDTPVVGYTF